MGTPFSAESWIRTISDLIHLGISNFILTGGEPTLLPGFNRLTASLARQTNTQPFFLSLKKNRARHYPISFVIMTNGDTDAWTPRFCQSLSGTRCRVHVHWTGPDAVHDVITGGTSARTLRTIQSLLAANVNLALNVPLLPENVGEIRPALTEILALGARHVNIMRVLPVGQARLVLSNHDNFLSPGAFLRACQDIATACHRHGATCSVGSLIPACAFPANPNTPSSNVTIPHLCGCGTSSFCIDPSGLIRPCTCSPVIGGTLQRLNEAFNAPSFRAFQQRQCPPACTNCPTRDRCSGGCPAAWHGEVCVRTGNLVGHQFGDPVGYPAGDSRTDPWITVPDKGGFPS